MEASMEPAVEEEEEEGGAGSAGCSARGHVHLPGDPPLRCPSSSALSQAGSDQPCGSGGSTPTCSSGACTPRGAPAPAGPEGQAVATAAARLAAVSLSTEPEAVPTARSGSQPAAACPCTCPPDAAAAEGGSASGLQTLGSAGSLGSSRRSSLESDGSKPCIRAINANWHAWVAVRDSPSPGAGAGRVGLHVLGRAEAPGITCPSTPQLGPRACHLHACSTQHTHHPAHHPTLQATLCVTARSRLRITTPGTAPCWPRPCCAAAARRPAPRCPRPACWTPRSRCAGCCLCCCCLGCLA